MSSSQRKKGGGDKSSASKGSSSRQTDQGPQFRWRIWADGINREVISADIQRYLGPDAAVRRSTTRIKDQSGREHEVYIYEIAGFKTFTTAQLEDLKADSANFEILKRANPRLTYMDSTVHRSRQYYGPSDEVAAGSVTTSYGSPTPQGMPTAFSAAASHPATSNPRTVGTVTNDTATNYHTNYAAHSVWEPAGGAGTGYGVDATRAGVVPDYPPYAESAASQPDSFEPRSRPLTGMPSMDSQTAANPDTQNPQQPSVDPRILERFYIAADGKLYPRPTS